MGTAAGMLCVFLVIVHTHEDMLLVRRAQSDEHALLTFLRRELMEDNADYEDFSPASGPAVSNSSPPRSTVPANFGFPTRTRKGKPVDVAQGLRRGLPQFRAYRHVPTSRATTTVKMGSFPTNSLPRKAHNKLYKLAFTIQVLNNKREEDDYSTSTSPVVWSNRSSTISTLHGFKTDRQDSLQSQTTAAGNGTASKDPRGRRNESGKEVKDEERTEEVTTRNLSETKRGEMKSAENLEEVLSQVIRRVESRVVAQPRSFQHYENTSSAMRRSYNYLRWKFSQGLL